MNLENILVLILCALLAIYLGYALLRAERF